MWKRMVVEFGAMDLRISDQKTLDIDAEAKG
jgi:hypothetical protein